MNMLARIAGIALLGISTAALAQSWPQKPVSARFRGEFWLRRNSFHPHPGGASTQIENLYPNQTPTPWLAVQLLPVLTSNPK